MEPVEKYRKIILQVLREYTEAPIAYGELEDEIIVDPGGGSLSMDGQRISETQTNSRLYRPH